MPLVQAKCTNCGAILNVDNTKDASICPYCGSAFIVEKAINNYNITNNIHANVVNVFGGNSADFVIRAGTLEKYTGAATDVVIPNSVTIIGYGAFQYCKGMTSVVIPDSVTEIGKKAFEWCEGLTSVTIPDSVTEIGDGAFDGCTRLTSITIPDSVTEIGDSVFHGCTRLTSITIPDSVTTIGERAFQDCTRLTSVTIPGSVTTIGERAFENCDGLTSLKILNGVKEICNDAFASCTGLTNVTIPGSVTKIGERAFFKCDGLTSVTISGIATKVESWAFSGCTRLAELSILGNAELSTFTIRDCHNLKIINAPKEWKRQHWRCHKSLEGYNNEVQCYIATAVYGSYNCPQVWVLRRYRDRRLAKTWYGRLFIHVYYAISPTLVRWFGKADWFQSFFRSKLDRIVHRLKKNGFEDTYYEDKSW